MITPAATPQHGSWSLIVSALAELGAREIERRTQAQQAADTTPRRDDETAQPDQKHDAARADQA